MSDEAPPRSTGVLMLGIFGLAIFLGALLLFQVQPLIARFILPWFGGSPAVWTTSVLFFQGMLLVGYAYAHVVATTLTVRAQVVVHSLFVILAVVYLPIVPSDELALGSPFGPTLTVLLMLAGAVGVPFTLLSATSPLLQRWFTRVAPGVSVYRFYALSNAGSLIGLLSYPFVVEPLLSRLEQARLWGAVFVIQAVACALCGLALWRSPAASDRVMPESPGDGRSPTKVDRLLWIALPATASALLLAFTNQICQDVASMPFLWVVPMALYLMSFVLCFDSGRWYDRRIFAVLLVLALEGTWAVLLSGRHAALWVQVAVCCAALFVACMVCHGELYQRRPGPRQLTSYYLMISVGGAVGGLFVGVLAPMIFNDYLELHVGLVAVGVLAVFCYRSAQPGAPDRLPRWARAAVLVAVVAVAVALGFEAVARGRQSVERNRNFHGVLRLVERDADDPVWHRLALMHGGTDHGFQFQDPARRDFAVAYYGRASGAGVALTSMQRPNGVRVGLVGLGAGILATHGRDGDHYEFFEINPAVIDFAERAFSYLADSRAHVEVREGDGRLLIESEPDHSLDVIVLDAFSSDSIPVHLLTTEAFAAYERVLAEDGVLALHLTNRHMDLVPVAARLGQTWTSRPRTFVVNSPRDDREGTYFATYVVLSNNSVVSQALEAAGGVPATPEQRAGTPWTDDFSNPLEVLSWR